MEWMVSQNFDEMVEQALHTFGVKIFAKQVQ